MKPTKEAISTVEDMQRKGVQVQRFPPADLTRTLDYTVLSDFLDALIYDIHRVCPELFANTTPVNTTPGRLKAYLYCLVIHHFKQAGCLVNVGGISFPDCAGASAPTPLLAWLQFIGVYAEGDTVGRAKYSVPATIPVVGTTGIQNGAVAETAIANSSQDPRMFGYTLNTTQVEYILATNSADANNVIVNWNTNSDSISDLLESSNYPTMPMWAVPPAVPDASFFGLFCRQSLTTGAGDQFFTNPFDKWDHEISLLYSLSTPVGDFGAIYATRPGPMGTEWPLTSTTYANAYWIRKEMFIFIVRNGTYAPGIAPEQMRYYHGDKLKTFRIVPILMDFSGWHEVQAKAILQLNANGAAFDTTQVWSTLITTEHAMMRRLQLQTIGEGPNQFDATRQFLPSVIDELVVPAPLAQVINDLGPVVRDDILHLPCNPVANVRWYTNWDVLGPGDVTIVGQWNYSLSRTAGAGDPVLKWSAPGCSEVTLNAAWVTAYNLLTNFLYGSWVAVMRAHAQMVKFVSNGVNYGKGDFLYPVSKGPRGGLVMLTRSLFDGTVAKETTDNSMSLTYVPLKEIGAYVPVTGAEITMVAIARFGMASATMLKSCKYVRMFQNTGANAFVDRYISQTFGPGGTFQQALADAMEKRHGMNMDVSSGLVSANDNIDACLWDSIKSIAGTIAGAIQPAASKAAAIGCGAIPVIGRFASPICEQAATNLISFATDASKSSTNRHARGSAKGELGKYKKEVRSMKAIEDMELPEERPPRKTPRREAYDAYEEEDDQEDYRVPRYRRTRQGATKGKKRPSGRQKPKARAGGRRKKPGKRRN